jgi:hypothetical protein
MPKAKLTNSIPLAEAMFLLRGEAAKKTQARWMAFRLGRPTTAAARESAPWNRAYWQSEPARAVDRKG